MLKKISIYFAIVALFAGCADEDLAPLVTFDSLSIGAFPRLQELRTGEFDLANLGTSSYEMVVDFVDNAGGQDVTEYRLFVSFDDNNPDNGDNSTEFEMFRAYPASEFTVQGDDGNLGVVVNLPFTDLAAFVGVDGADVISGDVFRVRAELEKTDETVFTEVNSTPAVINAFGGIFNFNILATCPLPDDAFVGDYVLTYGEVYDAFELFGSVVTPLGEQPFSKTVTLATIPGSTTRRTFAIGPYLVPGFNFDAGTVTLNFACDNVTSTDIDSGGAACTTGSLSAAQIGIAEFDLNDDSTWTINFNDFADDGGCGVAEMPFSLVFTKQ